MNWLNEKKCIIAEIGGGLGNQLFGYATGLATSYNLNMPLYLDISSLEHDGFGRNYQLLNFNINENISKLSRKTNLDKIKRKIIIHNYLCVKKIDELNGKNLNKSIYIYNNANNQSFMYFDFLKPVLKEKLHLKFSHSNEYLKIKKIIETQRTCAIHMRFGDYMKYGYCLDPQYYLDTVIDYIANIKTTSQILVFTDDYNEAKRILDNLNVDIRINYITELGELRDIEEFCLISECHDFIISNSTFSWWGAYLGEKDDSVVFAPVINGWIENCWTDDYFPTEWIRKKTKLMRNI